MPARRHGRGRITCASGTLTAGGPRRGRRGWTPTRSMITGLGSCSRRSGTRAWSTGRMVTVSKPEVIAFYLDAEVADDDPHREIKHRAAAILAAQEETGRAERKGHAGARAGRLDEAVSLFCDEAFDPREVLDTAREAGWSEADLDAAA